MNDARPVRLRQARDSFARASVFLVEPIETGGKLMSLTIVLLVALIGYTAYFGWSGGKRGNVLVTAFALRIVYKCAFALSIAQLRTGVVPT